MKMIKQKLKFSTQSKVVIITIVLALILLCNVLAPHKEYITGQILFAKDKLIYVKTDEEHSFKPTWDKMELVEKSTTPDDSVCIVSDITKEQKKDFKDYTWRNGNHMRFYDHMQRISHNKFAQISYTYKKPFIFAKQAGYEKKSGGGYGYAENFGSRLTSIKLQIYDIDKKKVILDRELITDNLTKERYAMLYGYAGEMLITKSLETNRLAIAIPFCSQFAPDDKLYPFLSEIDKNGITGKIPYTCYTECFSEYDEQNWLNEDSFKELLRNNGVNTEGVTYVYNIVDYNEVNLMIKSENLPASNAYLYKAYPKLKKYIGKKGKVAKFYLKGLKNSDELGSYFLPEGQKVNYGDGIRINKKNKVKSLDEYNKISHAYKETPSNERLSEDIFDFK